MTTLPPLTDTSPDEPVVTVLMIECRRCGESSDWYRDNHDDLATPHDWSVAHGRATAHRFFYTWSMTRRTTQVFWA